MQLLSELYVDLHVNTSIFVPTTIKLWISVNNLSVFGIFMCLQPMVQLHVAICNISPRSVVLKLMFKFCRYWVRKNLYQTIPYLNMNMAVSKTQKAVLKMAFRYVFTVTFTHAMKNSKLLLYFSNSLFFFIRI